MELVLTVLLATVLCVGAQSTNVTACVDGRGWLVNSVHQNPCLVAAYLLQECAVIVVDIPAQIPGYHYPQPGDKGFPPNQCSCSSVGYSILAACSYCQNQPYPKWTNYSEACNESVSFSWTEPIPALTAIPAWAFDNPTASNGWDSELANGVALRGTPDVTANLTTPTTITTTPTVTEPVESSPTPSTDTISNDKDAPSSRAPVGAIVGGVVGGLAALGLGAIGIALVLRYTHSKDGPQPVRPSGSRWPSSNSMISRWVKSGGQHAYSPGIQPFDQSQTTTYVAPQPTSSGMNTISSSRVLGYNQHVAEV